LVQKTPQLKARSGPAGLVKEWLVAHLGEAFGLPIPPYKVAWVDDLLVKYGDFDIDAGYCFASEYQANIQEITFNQLNSVPKSILRDLFVFDYWIRNNDRALTIHGGNANFFYDQITKETFVLDHNLSFDEEFSIENHTEQHVGAVEWSGFDLIDRQTYEIKFEKAMEVVDNAICKIPEEWLEHYSLATIEEEVVKVLNEYKTNEFWEGIEK